MKGRSYFITTASIFTVIAVLHFLRLVLDWPAKIGSVNIPMWVSWLALIIAAFLAYRGFSLRK